MRGLLSLSRNLLQPSLSEQAKMTLYEFGGSEMWNIAVAVLGGVGIAAGGRLLIRYTGQYTFHSRLPFLNNRKKKRVDSISEILQEPVRNLENLDEQTQLIQEGETVDLEERIKNKIEEKAGFKPGDTQIFREEMYDPNQKVDYVICFSNASIRSKGVRSQIVAAALAKALIVDKKKVTVYGFGSDLIKVDTVDPQGILKLPTQSGFNAYHALGHVYGKEFDNPTYLFCITDSDAAVTDKRMEGTALPRMANHTNVVGLFIEIGFQKYHDLQNIAKSTNSIYLNVPGDYNSLSDSLLECMRKAAENMRGVMLNV